MKQHDFHLNTDISPIYQLWICFLSLKKRVIADKLYFGLFPFSNVNLKQVFVYLFIYNGIMLDF